jgi:hypothetical protein
MEQEAEFGVGLSSLACYLWLTAMSLSSPACSPLLGVQVAADVRWLSPYCRSDLGEAQYLPAFYVRCWLMRGPWPLVGSLL